MTRKVSKVAFLVGEFPVFTETFILNQVIFLLDRGFDVQVFTLYPGRFDRLHAQYLKYGLQDRISVVASVPKNPFLRLKELTGFFKTNGLVKNILPIFKCLNPLHFGFQTFSFSYALYYIRLARIIEYDVIHAHFGGVASFFSKFRALGIFDNIPFVVSFHGFDLLPTKTDIYKTAYKKLFEQVNLVTVNSFYTQSILEKVNQTERFPIQILPVGLDTSLFCRTSISSFEGAKRRIVFCGRLEFWKGPDIAVEIARKLRWELGVVDFELFVIGEGSQFESLNNTVEEYMLADRVYLLGALDQLEIVKIFSQTHIFLYPGRKDPLTGRSENQGLVLQEAQSMEIPVITADVGGIRFGMLPEVSGYLVAEGDIDGFVGKVLELLEDEEKRRMMGKAGRKYVVENFDNQVLGEKLLELYESVVL